MIQRMTFLGIPLRTLAHRRALVLAYYGLLLLFVAVPMYLHKLLGAGLLIQVFSLGTLFGGITTTGPVKYFGDNIPEPDPTRTNPISLNLAGRLSPFTPSLWLDERELATRDHAHWVAYRLLLVTLLCAFLSVFIAATLNLTFMEHNMTTLLWGLLIFALSLPQSVILWTEPAPIPEGTLTIVDARP